MKVEMNALIVTLRTLSTALAAEQADVVEYVATQSSKGTANEFTPARQ
jgi:hypothetical protein